MLTGRQDHESGLVFLKEFLRKRKVYIWLDSVWLDGAHFFLKAFEQAGIEAGKV